MMTISGGKRRASLAWLILAHSAVLETTGCASSTTVATVAPISAATWVFAAPADARADSSLRAVAPRIDALVSGVIQLDSITGLPALLYPDDAGHFPGTSRRFALVSSKHGQRFHPETVRRLASDRTALALIASRVGALVASGGYQGVVFDLEGQSRDDIPLVQRFIRAAADSIRNRGASLIAVTLPAADTTAYPTRAFASVADVVIVMLFDEHRPASSPGPIASPEWVRRTLAQRVSDVGAARVVALFPLFGYLWRSNQPASVLDLNQARHAAAESAIEIGRDPASGSLHAVKANDWELWLADDALLRTLRTQAIDLGVPAIAITARPF